jgi:hypothetical protein
MAPPATARAAPAAAPGDGAPHQPPPRRLYVHDDLTDEVARRLGPSSTGAALAASLLGVVARDRGRVRVIRLAQQLQGLTARRSHAPFALTLAIGRAGERVAGEVHARTGWFPHVRVVGLTRVEDGGGYRLVSTVPASLREQLAGAEDARALAVVDDTVFSGLTMRSLLEALPPGALARTHAFCARGVADSIREIGRLCPIAAGFAARGRLLDDVSFINASGLVLRIAVRRRDGPSLAFFERPQWIRAWFPGSEAEVIELSARLNALLEPAASAGPPD